MSTDAKAGAGVPQEREPTPEAAQPSNDQPAWIGALDPQAERQTLSDLLVVMRALRDPEHGCPWDREQTFATIAPYTIEEAYEVADAIDRGTLEDVRDELGDLLLQVVYHAQIAAEANAFAFDDVVDGITKKMIRRHPHVFGSAAERAAGIAPGFWEAIKAQERAAKASERGDVATNTPSAGAGPQPPQRLLDSVPVALPALTRAAKLQERAARVGFDWPSLEPVFDKMREELGELDQAIAQEDRAGAREELGDLLFVIANVARHLKVDPEVALRDANAKFTRRFAHIEDRLAAAGRTPDDASLEEMDGYWNEARARDNGSA
ncbi:MAG: nucleoside triphosphate pyrophosphohydrolase [Pseudomonadota bacterium]